MKYEQHPFCQAKVCAACTPMRVKTGCRQAVQEHCNLAYHVTPSVVMKINATNETLLTNRLEG